MPISRDVLTPQQAEAGHIKIGKLGKPQTKKGREGTYRLPEKLEENKLPYFLVTKMVREGGGGKDENFEVDLEIMERLATDKDGKCRRISVMFDSDIIEENWHTSLLSYVGDELSCANHEGGKIAKRLHVVDNKREWKDQKCPCDRLNARNDPKCKPNGTLWATILAGDEAEIGARHSFRTTGWNSIKAIDAALPLIQRIVGTISGIKLWLVITPIMKKDRDRKWRRVPVVTVRFRSKDLLRVQQHAIETVKRRHMVMQLASNPQVLALAAPGVAETPAQQAAVAAEWYPTTQADEIVQDFEDDGDDGEEIIFDPETGVVTEPQEPAGDKPSDKGTQPAIPKQDKDEKPQPPTVELMERIGTRLRDLAIARGFDPMNEDEFKGALKECFKQIAADYVSDEPLMFKSMTRKQAELAFTGISRELETIAARDAGEQDDGGVP